MKAKKTTPAPTPRPKPTLAEVEAETRRSLLRMCEGILENHAKCRAKLAAAITDPDPAKAIYSTGYELEWAADLAGLTFKARIAQSALAKPAEGEYQDVLQRLVYWERDLRRSLLRNAFRPSSTGAFHNACEIAKAEAARNLHDDLTHALGWLRRAVAEAGPDEYTRSQELDAILNKEEVL